MANTNPYYNRSADYNPDEIADGDAIEAEFDSIQRGFKNISDYVDAKTADIESSATVYTDESIEALRLSINESLNEGVLNWKTGVRDLLSKEASVAGYNLVDGSFSEGASLSGWQDVVLDWDTLKYYQWHLDEAKIVAVGSSPTNIGTLWIDKSTTTLKLLLATQSGASYIGDGENGRTVSDYISDNVSANDVASLSDLDSKVKNKFIPAGNYTFNGPNITTIGDIDVSKRAVVANNIYSGIIQQDADIAWLQQNHLENEFRVTTREAITSGNIPKAPKFTGDKQRNVKVLAYWYNDFGLEATRYQAGLLGDLMWYYWSWLFHGASGDGYQPERHPWLGYYRGDDANVLDWQCFWLNEAGVSGVIPQTRGDFTNIRARWSSPTDVDHWIYQLLTNCKNMQSLEYALWAYTGSTSASAAAKVESSFTEIVEIYNEYDNFSYVSNSGGVYPVVYAFEAENWRGVYDNYNGTTGTKSFLIAQAAKFKAKGWAGFCLLGRTGPTGLIGDRSLEAAGVICLSAGYESTNYTPTYNGGVSATTYADLAIGVGVKPDSSTLSAKFVVPNVVTAKKSHSAHTSTFNYPGSTPELFNVMVRNCLKRMQSNGSPKILTIYNVSEWAEGGPSLQPNMRDGKGYIWALRDALSTVVPDINESRIYRRQTVQFLSGPTIQCAPEDGCTTIPMSISYAWSSTALPFINDPLAYNGKRIRLILDNSSVHSGPLVLQDEATLSGTGLKLITSTVSLGKNDSLELEFDSTQAKWIQVGVLSNVL